MIREKKLGYKNIKGLYYQRTHQPKGLAKILLISDEYELHDAFSKASYFGMLALENMFNAKRNDDEKSYKKSRRIFDECLQILNTHFWGVSYIEKLKRYKERLEIERTVKDDIKEYFELIQECKLLSLEYAKANIDGITDEEMEKFSCFYGAIFTKEKLLTEFIPSDELNKIFVNLHWMKIDAERDSKKFIVENSTNISPIYKKQKTV